ncbi:MAG: calcineurin-like phosphoesterase family protein [Ignavibacteriaceae bacterium]|nr:calcineurin-like phosphoesterase family protein [Ignavibacteriaceae bacterium]
MNRRNFLRSLSAIALLTTAENIIARPYRDLLKTRTSQDCVRISGVVKAGNYPLRGVVVSDGINCTATKADGSYSLITQPGTRFVFISVPTGYSVPLSGKGIAFFYKDLLNISPTDDIRADFSLSKSGSNGVKHVFYNFADPQMIDDADMDRFANETIPDLKQEISRNGEIQFGVGCGDIVFNRHRLFPGYVHNVGSSGIPFFQVVGNHDVIDHAKVNEEAWGVFCDYFGPEYYSFNVGDVHYIVLNDVFWFGDYMGYIDYRQLTWLKNDLSFIEKGRRLVIFSHIPFYTRQHLNEGRNSPSRNVIVTNRELIYDLVRDYEVTFISGHMHESDYFSEGRNEIHVTGAVCGAWWTADVCSDGTPNGYGVYEVNGSEIKRRYKATGRDASYQMRVYKDTDDSGAQYATANIWAVSHKWDISAFVNGSDKMKMERFTGVDPQTTGLFLGDKIPEKHSWVEPGRNSHLFRIPLNKEMRFVTVEATDEYGRIYTGRLDL